MTMKRVADELGSGTMSLYRHIVDRDDLVMAMVDAIGSRVEHPQPQASPSDELVAIYGTFYTNFRREPWLVRCLVEGHQGSSHILPLVERAVIALEKLGFKDHEVWQMFDLLTHYTYGEVLVREGEEQQLRRAPDRQPNMDMLRNYPAILRSVAAAILGDRSLASFETNIRRLLGNLKS